jgi:hypothetical protein
VNRRVIGVIRQAITRVKVKARGNADGIRLRA